jgi:hypothetical protein
MLKYSLFGLFLVVLIACFGFAAMAANSELSRQAMLTLTVALLIAANLAAIFRPPGKRAFAGGFAIAGWIYFLLSFDVALGLRDNLLTHRLGEPLWTVMHEFPIEGQNAEMKIWEAGTGAAPNPRSQSVFYDIVHANWTLFVALLRGEAANGERGCVSPTVFRQCELTLGRKSRLTSPDG